MKDYIERLRKAEHLISAAMAAEMTSQARTKLLEARAAVILVRVGLMKIALDVAP